MKRFMTTSSNIERDSYIWNMMGSMLNAFQSVIMLILLTRAVDLTESGIFTIAYANASLFLYIGKYGMRNFQVSDVKHQFTFREYNLSRYITTAAMLLVSVVYVLIASKSNDYSSYKSLCIIWMCLFKIADSLEDVYLGLYQQEGRLDIAGKCMTLRMVITIVAFGVSIIIFKSLLTALIIATVLTFLLFIVLILITYPSFKTEKVKIRSKSLLNLLWLCFPLFIGTFLAFYIGNAPKYAIDSILNDELQACYGFIAMPVFVIGMLNNFIFNPIIAKMAALWADHNTKKFKQLFFKQLGIVLVITLVCEIGAFLIGIPVLSFLYNTDLLPYKSELLILLVGGGFLAISGFMCTIITIMRHQNLLAFCYLAVALAAYIFSPMLVRSYEMMGAAVLYVALMFLLCLLFLIPLIYGFKKEKETVKS